MQTRPLVYSFALITLGIGTVVPSMVQGQTGPARVSVGYCDYPDAEVVNQGLGKEASPTVPASRYLSAHHACLFADYRTAADRYALALAEDPRNPVLVERAAMAYLGMGQVDAAAAVSRVLAGQSTTNSVTGMVLLAEALKRQDFDAVIEDIESRESETLIDGLLIAWARLGQGRMSEALQSFDEIASEQKMETHVLMHKALAQALVGDYEGSEAILSDLEQRGALNRDGIIKLAQVLGHLERSSEALDLIGQTIGAARDPEVDRLISQLADGSVPGFDVVRSATEGAAEVFLLVAGLLDQDRSAPPRLALRYSRIAEYLNPESVDAMLLSADLLGELGRFELATESYNRVPRDHFSFTAAEIGRADALRQSGKIEAAVEVLEQLVELRPEAPYVRSALGDVLRGVERYGRAGEAYDAAVALYEETGQDAPWRLYFVRGITHERERRWELAEADFRKALELEPDHPDVLNYLGYSFLEMGANLDEALEMIEKAAAAKPESYYIIDSLGWAHYRMGRYEEAVESLERAVELEPVDPIVNDHLGDAYWAVGRRFEAEFQWRRALSFDPEEEEAQRIRRKLEVGLDAVLEEEGAPPLGLVVRDG